LGIKCDNTSGIIHGKIVCIAGILCPASMERSAAIAFTPFNWWKGLQEEMEPELLPIVLTLVDEFEPCNQKPDGSWHWKC